MDRYVIGNGLSIKHGFENNEKVTTRELWPVIYTYYTVTIIALAC